MGAKASQWAACFTWSFKTFGIHSTQRVEAIHSVIQSFCSKHSSITDLVHDLERMAEHHLQKSETGALRQEMNIFLGSQHHGTLFRPALVLSEKLTAIAASSVRAQAAQIPLYSVLTNEQLSIEQKTMLDFKPDEDVYCVEIRADVIDPSSATLSANQDENRN
jgi:hypothetical protein